MADTSIGTPEQLRDPNYTPPLHKAVPLGIQHVLAMFVSNVTPAIIVAARRVRLRLELARFPQLIYMIQMSMLFAGHRHAVPDHRLRPGRRALPIVQGTSFAFIPIMIPLVAGKGVDALAALFGGVLIGGLFHAFARPRSSGASASRCRRWSPGSWSR
jgi:xanthine/uracil permease